MADKKVTVLARFKAKKGLDEQLKQAIMACVAPTRAEAEDIAAAVVLDLEPLRAVHDMRRARDADAALVHEHWGDNVFLETLSRVFENSQP